MLRKLLTVLAAIGLVAFLAAPSAYAGPGPFTTYSAKATFADVKTDLETAIVNKGLVVDFVADVGDMLQRTAKDLGAAKKVYENANMVMFCSAKFTREAVEADAANIIFCPYSLVIYELSSDPGTVQVGYRVPRRRGSLESRKALLAIEELLDSIAREATGN